ncbi:MAG: hypothetical protein ACYDCK_10050 [Thermoplasmatota archaeon]
MSTARNAVSLLVIAASLAVVLVPGASALGNGNDCKHVNLSQGWATVCLKGDPGVVICYDRDLIGSGCSAAN